MAGIELVRYVRKQAPFQKVVMTTATPADIEVVKSELCYEQPKPFTYQQLKIMLAGMVACEKTHGDGARCFEHGLCQFGLEHLCPFTDPGKSA